MFAKCLACDIKLQSGEPIFRFLGEKIEKVSADRIEIRVFVEHTVPISILWNTDVMAYDRYMYFMPLAGKYSICKI